MHYFHPVLERALPPSLNLNHNGCSILPGIYVRRESMACGTKNISILPEPSEWTLPLRSRRPDRKKTKSTMSNIARKLPTLFMVDREDHF